MSLTHIRTFRVRYYECDAYGHVTEANYVRYMEEAAFAASAAAGYSMERYAALDRGWLVYETEIEYLGPLYYDDRVEVKTWVQDFRRVRSRRAYELRLAGTGQLAARAGTDWVYMQLSTRRPVVIEDDLKAAFFPEGPPQSLAARRRFPPSPPPPAGAFRWQRRVEWRDLDAAGHVNNAVYVDYIQEGWRRMMAAQGWPLERLRAEGVTLRARRQQLEYKVPALLDEDLEIETWLSEAAADSVLCHAAIRRAGDGRLVLRGRTLYVALEPEGQGLAVLPPGLVADLGPLMAG